jgi:hypothetical protein
MMSKVDNLITMLNDVDNAHRDPSLRYKHIMKWDYSGSYHAIMVVSNDGK